MTEFERLQRVMKKKLNPIALSAWEDRYLDNYSKAIKAKEAISDLHPQESIRPMTAEEKAIWKFKFNHDISEETQVTFDDVLYHEHGTDRDVYLRRNNTFCDIGSTITLGIRNGQKVPL